MSVDWSGYEPHRPLHDTPHYEMSRTQARAEYRHTLATKPDRIEQLTHLLRANEVTLGHDDKSVQELDYWFQANVRADPGDPSRLRDLWYAVCHDIGLFLGDLMVARFPQLQWKLYVWGQRNVSYHKHVIMGFTQTLNQKYNVDVERVVSTHGHRIVAVLEEDPYLFVKMLDLSDKA